MLTIFASSDIHAPRYTGLFLKSLGELAEQPDLIILAGDLVEKNNVYAFKPIYEYLLEKYRDKPLIAVFGNEEYRGFEEKYRELYGSIKWLNDEHMVLEINGYRLGVVGTRGALDKPTTWQSKHVPGIYRYYSELPSIIRGLIEKLVSQNVDGIILVSHYGVTYSDLEGEPESIWVHLASRKFEDLIKSTGVDLVIHGHVHNGVREVVYLNNTPVYNVSLPARGRVVVIKYKPASGSKKIGLERWLKR